MPSMAQKSRMKRVLKGPNQSLHRSRWSGLGGRSDAQEAISSPTWCSQTHLYNTDAGTVVRVAVLGLRNSRKFVIGRLGHVFVRGRMFPFKRVGGFLGAFVEVSPNLALALDIEFGRRVKSELDS